jgi:sec-independent protein translocase protein TatA
LYFCIGNNKDMTLNIILGFLGGLGGTETILIIAVLLLFFGAKRIPDLAKGLGRGIKEFKDASKGVGEEDAKSIEDKK